MKLVIDPSKSRVFCTLFDILSNIVDELNIEFKADKLYIQTMDSSHISLFELDINSEWFDCFDIDKTIIIGVKLSIINKILGCRHPSQYTEISYNDDIEDKIEISLINGNKGTFDKFYQTSVYDFDNELLSIPIVDADAEFTMNSITIYKLFEQLKQFGENIKIICNDESIVIDNVEGEYFTGMKVKISDEDIIEYSVIENDKVEVEYCITPLCKAFSIARLSKDANISDNFKIYISKESPIMIEFKMFEKSSIKFWVAPKISLDD